MYASFPFARWNRRKPRLTQRSRRGEDAPTSGAQINWKTNVSDLPDVSAAFEHRGYPRKLVGTGNPAMYTPRFASLLRRALTAELALKSVGKIA
jgi:hypothetical protein